MAMVGKCPGQKKKVLERRSPSASLYQVRRSKKLHGSNWMPGRRRNMPWEEKGLSGPKDGMKSSKKPLICRKYGPPYPKPIITMKKEYEEGGKNHPVDPAHSPTVKIVVEGPIRQEKCLNKIKNGCKGESWGATPFVGERRGLRKKTAGTCVPR